MKIIFLNAWDGKLPEEISEYIAIASKDTDVFCFQEAGEKMKSVSQNILGGWNEVAGEKVLSYDDRYLLSTYSKNVSVVSSRVLFDDQETLGLGLYTKVSFKNTPIHIFNFHGMAYQEDDKLDNPERLKRSKEIIDFLKYKNGPKIIGGDFNILPQAQSIRMFEENGYKDLIKEFKISTTRNRLAWERWPTKMYFSDYVFISPDVKIKNFTVPDIEISDHLPMELEIEL